MPQLAEICALLESFAPLRLAEQWDNVGLLVGDRETQIDAIMTCLTITPSSVAEAVSAGADLIVTHHPLPFRPLTKITTDSTPGRLLLRLIGSGICVYSAHTAFDSAAGGINQQLAAALGLDQVVPLTPALDDPDGLGSGRVGKLPAAATLAACAARLKDFLDVPTVRVVGNAGKPIQKVAIGCGSAGQFLSSAIRQGCDLMVTGEATFHTCLEAEASSTALMLVGHYASERFAVAALARELATRFANTRCWASERERDPLTVL
jgi:dinuclear metal center YbgI/SA1388 family protein